jgi:ATP-dependent RNA helicase DeaD
MNADLGQSAVQSDLVERLGEALGGALEKKGYTALTAVQEAVLDPALEGRDLRISSQTGSGKTVAIGIALRDLVTAGAPSDTKNARPVALVVTPTRELAKQVEQELSWLYAPLSAKVAAVTGGGGYRDELRAFRHGPAVVVGTPGRLLDHLNRGSIDASSVGAVVLDEADRMLDMGFRDDIEAIMGHAPKDRQTHLVSATFPREVKALADRVQKDPARVEGTPLGAANADIDHVVHLVRPEQGLAAIINLLLSTPGAQTLIFVRTRADVTDLTAALNEAGFVVAPLSGEMEQAERNRALAAFKRGRLDALVATDVAARGIDVQDIARVIHASPPDDADAYTHRSGRTGRAGRKGTSALLLSPSELRRTSGVLERARVRFRIEPVPARETIAAARDEALYLELTGDDAPEPDEAAWTLAKRVAEAGHTTRALARLVAKTRGAERAEPRDVTPIHAPEVRTYTRAPAGPAGRGAPRGGPREGGARDGGGHEGEWVPFRVSWGQAQGADARRLLAMICRRGGIDGRDVGAIRIAPTFSVVEVTKAVAKTFEKATRDPDPRNPRVSIRPWEGAAPPPPKRKR